MTTKTFTIKGFTISSLNDFLQALVKDITISTHVNAFGNDAYLLASAYGHLEIMKYLDNEHEHNVYITKNNKW